jgi:hypothetical protein
MPVKKVLPASSSSESGPADSKKKKEVEILVLD